MSITYSMPFSHSFVDLINNAGALANQIAQSIGATSGISQQDPLYEMVKLKNERVRGLRENFKNMFSGDVYLTDHIFHAVRHKPKNANIKFFNMQTIGDIQNSVIVLSNNNVMTENTIQKYVTYFVNNPTNIYVIWDFDNHHWFALSGMLAAASDLYIPTHGDNIEPLSRYNNIIAGPIGSGVIQWPKEFLEEHNNIIMNIDRSNDPLGTHIEYPQFPLRQKNLTILNKTLPSVKLVDGSYHSREMLDRFKEWCSHKVHWIVPVLNDAPIRIFDALITGGIPIVPRSIKYHRDVIDLWDHVLFYDYNDIQNPLEITQKAINLFDERGIKGVLDRHELSLYNYHVDKRVKKILEAVSNEFTIEL